MKSVATSVRIPGDAEAIIAALAKKMGTSKAQVIDRAVRELQEKVFWEEVQIVYADLADDPARLAQYRQEIADWDLTLRDGLPAATHRRGKR